MKQDRKSTGGNENKIETNDPTVTEGTRVRAIPEEVRAKYTIAGAKLIRQDGEKQTTINDNGASLATRAESDFIAGHMVRIAAARGWKDIRVTGTDDFRRRAWLEAEARGMSVNGYIPTENDKANLSVAKNMLTSNNDTTQGHDQVSRQKAMTEAYKRDSISAVKEYPELSGALALSEAAERKAIADGLNEKQRAVVANRVKENIAKSIEQGTPPNIQVKEQETTRLSGKTKAKELSR